ncbi:radical SAM protein [Candidatus Woesearchaeota archaeon]|nr:radical SAM protein [Candidatus Woesearchaeota archaeon]
MQSFNVSSEIITRHGFKRTLYTLKKPTPIMGVDFIGLTDRCSNLIEVKPITGCNLNCIYCWVSDIEKTNDFTIPSDYIVEEFSKLKRLKKHPVQAHLLSHGDILLYKQLPELVKDLKSLNATTSIDCHLQSLTQSLVQELIDSGLDRLNVTIDTLNPEKVFLIYKQEFDLEDKLEIIKQAALKLDIVISPVLMPSINKDEALAFINWVKKHIPKRKHPRLLFQKYIPYNPSQGLKSESFKTFKEFLKSLELKTGEHLIFKPEEFGIFKDECSKPVFKLGQHVNVQLISPSRVKNQFLGIAKNKLLKCNASKELLSNVKNKDQPFIGAYFQAIITRVINNCYECQLISNKTPQNY